MKNAPYLELWHNIYYLTGHLRRGLTKRKRSNSSEDDEENDKVKIPKKNELGTSHSIL